MQQNNNDKKRVNPLAAGVAGVVVGAGIAVVGAVAFKDEKNRAKVKNALHSVGKQVNSYVEDLEKSARKQKTEIKGKMEEVKKIV